MHNAHGNESIGIDEWMACDVQRLLFHCSSLSLFGAVEYFHLARVACTSGERRGRERDTILFCRAVVLILECRQHCMRRNHNRHSTQTRKLKHSLSPSSANFLFHFAIFIFVCMLSVCVPVPFSVENIFYILFGDYIIVYCAECGRLPRLLFCTIHSPGVMGRRKPFMLFRLDLNIFCCCCRSKSVRNRIAHRCIELSREMAMANK